ncbi:hypothetical protein GFL39_26075 [Rhizobium leguminosarum bv. viciae]|uniref:hypothetical protein n=1 Tax=Rhizobium leguminosarum TaxID=384 RepID=UPI001441B32E|nr:hypothetical protein [Rhizobium leguminosarum]NKL08341.1 hypothetical protein [Rhizobium leguminosarum bv. viciae]
MPEPIFTPLLGFYINTYRAEDGRVFPGGFLVDRERSRQVEKFVVQDTGISLIGRARVVSVKAFKETV